MAPPDCEVRNSANALFPTRGDPYVYYHPVLVFQVSRVENKEPYQVNFVPGIPQVHGCEGSQSSAQTVAGNDNPMARVGGNSLRQLGRERVGHRLPGLQETPVGLTAAAQ